MTPTSIRTRTAVAAVSATAVALLAAACGSDDPTTDTPAEDPTAVDVTAPPQIASWTTFGGIAVPLGTRDGPTSTPGAPLTGFTRTPQGAALAAIGQSVQLSTAADTAWSTILPAVTTAGAGRDAYAGNRALIQVSGTDPAVVPSIIGYTLPAYSPDAATVSIVQQFSDDSLAAVAAKVVWSDQDWKLALPEPAREPVPQDFVTAEVAGNPVTALDTVPTDMVALGGAPR
ncbi:hypothetical protein CH253_17735 [Rhodococcus sp. 06-156-3C]|uniref:hypothetical protein n=1 Tax=Nocardiaceae TaxID=85025 RepID=UPI0006896F35|nr:MULTISPECIES: hypothetical protein [Rhodococcus]OZD18306.1 hypothetical protein CH280_07060 [Rhodococcus sp. 06-156-4C]OZD18904.1 hypothetical protein CH253_17735 [Rhodococcus sp. 06-156-3C]OZD22414.1 hypothetical protein CH248_09320 [Rhodococcus sp. 06-156-4a]OZD33998.1 hypothetical protein CH247_07850 [Rhodococcus sp. 06-156-3b]OZD38735.1 hypothetical protein CH284_06270 [Rhodococcus sp. 06-156-3]